MKHRIMLALGIVGLLSLSLFSLPIDVPVGTVSAGPMDLEDGVTSTLENFTAVSTGLPVRGNYNCIIMGDVNGDGYDDLAASAGKGDNTAWPTYGLFVFTSDKGTSWVNSSTGLPTTGIYGGVDLGDLDGDGDLDLAAGGEGHANSAVKGVTIWLNNGTHNGTTDWVSGKKPESNRLYESVIIEDMDDDGNADIVAATYYDGVRVWLGNGGAGGSLSWTASSSGLPSSGQYVAVASGDFNNDGNADIVATSYFNPDPEVHLFTGDGNGSWTNWDSLMPKPGNYGQAYGVAVGDFDKDGNMDLVYGRKSYGVVCLLGNGGGTNGSDFNWTEANTGLPSSNHYYGAFVGDVDKDGNPDILLSNGFNALGLCLYLGNGGSGGTVSWTKARMGLTGDWFFGGALGDFNNDTVLDIVGSSWDNRTNGGIKAFRGALSGKRAPVATVVWNGTSSNETTVSVGETVQLDGRLSSDVEDAPDGDPTGA
ncbi:MAG: VCBS repeat-containing protein, partial [Thermoplasmata archaeon]|nr:VCBS repeat-containing protein [Thermoplasmata archaeon]